MNKVACVVVVAALLGPGAMARGQAPAGEAKAPAGTPPGGAPPGGAPPGPPKPAPELEQLKAMAGNWRCEGKFMAGAFAPAEHAIKATAKVKWELGNFWQTYVYEERKTKEHPMAAKVMGSWGWDANAKKFVRNEIDSFGGHFTATSPGWEGDRLVWTGDLSHPIAGRLPARHTFTKKGEREFSHVLELTMGGQPTQVFDVACKK